MENKEKEAGRFKALDCCAIHRYRYGYLCKCKKIWADDEGAREHIANCSYVRFSTKMYNHQDCPQSLARKIVSGNIDCYI